MIYLFTDGYYDQFGGEKNKRFTQKRLKDNLTNVFSLSTKNQFNEFENMFLNWKKALNKQMMLWY